MVWRALLFKVLMNCPHQDEDDYGAVVGIILPGESRSTRRQPCVTASFSIINPTWNYLGLNLDLCGERPVTNHMTHGTALNIYIHQNYTKKTLVSTLQRTQCIRIIKTDRLMQFQEINAGYCEIRNERHKYSNVHSSDSGKWPTWRTVFSIICLFESSTCFEQLCAHLQEDNCINTTSGIITLC
jgi:hypothetical protein